VRTDTASYWDVYAAARRVLGGCVSGMEEVGWAAVGMFFFVISGVGRGWVGGGLGEGEGEGGGGGGGGRGVRVFGCGLGLWSGGGGPVW
jgi:hypothetical protein